VRAQAIENEDASLTATPRTSRSSAGAARGLFALAAILVVALPASSRAQDPPAREPESPAAPAPLSAGESESQPAPMTPEARARYDEGLRLYADHAFAAAIRELEAGFALDPRREFLFAEAQAYRLSGDCARAIPLYERFLGSGPSPLQVDATRLALDRCARRTSPITPPPAPPLAPAPAQPVSPPVVERAPWWHDRWAAGALGAGLAATGVGLGFALAARSAADQADGPATTRYDDYNRLWNTAERRQTIGVVSLATGGALLAAGAVRLIWVHHREKRSGAEPSAVPPGMATIVVPAAGGASVVGLVNF